MGLRAEAKAGHARAHRRRRPAGRPARRARAVIGIARRAGIAAGEFRRDRLADQHRAGLPQREHRGRVAARLPATPWVLRVTALRRLELEFELESAPGGPWRQDRAGNVLSAPRGTLHWQRLLSSDLELGQVVAGEMGVSGDPLARARLRGQVVAVGPQSIDNRRFDAAVIELFGDAQSAGAAGRVEGESVTRVEGAIVVDRDSGVLLRLDLRSAHPSFSLQRRLVRVER